MGRFRRLPENLSFLVLYRNSIKSKINTNGEDIVLEAQLSEFNSVVDLINGKEDENKITASAASAVEEQSQEPVQDDSKKIVSERALPFDVAAFSKEVAHKSENKNRVYAEVAANINAYDVADNCIRQIIYKLSKTPTRSFGDKWLPLSFRATLGSACHDFIQGVTDQFTETEISMKIPSIRFSGRMDNLKGYNVLAEIKSCTYKDYQKILRDQKPRMADFYQVMTYKYILENFLEEAKDESNKTRSNKPALDHYDIDTLQFIYLAHDITASDVDDFSMALKIVDSIKKQLNSKRNPFYFITSMVLDVNTFDVEPYYTFIRDKIKDINEFLDSNTLPPGDNQFINRKKCFFCHYYTICDIK